MRLNVRPSCAADSSSYYTDLTYGEYGEYDEDDDDDDGGEYDDSYSDIGAIE